MAGSKLAKGFEKVVKASAKGIGELQIAVDKVLWGNPNPRNRRSSAEARRGESRAGNPSATQEVTGGDPRVSTPESTAFDNASGGGDVQPSNVNQATQAVQNNQTQVAGTQTPGEGDGATPTSDPRFSVQPEPQATPGGGASTAANTARGQNNVRYKPVETSPQRPNIGQRLISTGLFSALDALNSVDLCNVVTYAYDNINIKRKPRPERSTWSTAQEAFYTLQDGAGLVVTAIDKYYAYPNEFIGSYFGVGPNAKPPQQAVSQSTPPAPIEGGTKVSSFNMYYLLKSVGEVFSFNSSGTGSLFTQQDAQLLREVPGLASNLNFVNDFIGDINRYSDWNQIAPGELVRLNQKIGELRAVCVTIQNLNLRGAVSLAGNFVGADIRSQIQKLSEFVDVTRIIPTLKEINDSLRSFIRMANKVQKVIETGQFVIKLSIVFIKIFKFIVYFFGILPIPSMFLTAGAQTKIQDAKDAAKAETDGVTRILKSVNALLGVALNLVRYIVANTNELLRRLDTLLINLQVCDAFKDSDILKQLQQTRTELNDLLERQAIYLIDYDSKTDPEQALFGKYQIRIVEEQVTDPAIVNLRRRGIALDERGNIVVGTDLTFATDPQVIIGEVKQRLVAQGLVGSVTVDPELATILSQSYNYLSNNDIIEEDLSINPAEIDLPDNLNENKGLGINAFVNNLKGGRRLRRRTRAELAKNLREASAEIRKTDSTGQFTQAANNQLRQANQLEIANLRDQIREWQTQLTVALTQGPVGYAIVTDRRQKIVRANRRILELQRGG